MTQNVSVDLANKPKKRRRIASLDRRKARAGIFFVLPFLLGFLLVYVPLLFESVKYSFYNYTYPGAGRPQVQEFVGWSNYQEALFGSADFVQTLIVGLKELVFDIPAILIFSLFIAVILNQKMVGRAAFRAIFFLPVVVSTGLMETILHSSYISSEASMDPGAAAGAAGAESAADGVTTTQSGMALEALLQSVFENLGFGTGLVTYIVSAVASIADIVNRSGVQILIFLAALQSISPAIYESCQIDGATSWETFWKITFPMVSPMILVNGVYTIIDNFTTDSNSVMKVIKSTYISSKHASSAMGWMYFLLVLVIVGLVAAVFSAYVFYQRRD